MEKPVSIFPAPAPWMVTFPIRSVSKVRAFWAPMTPARGSVRGSFRGATEASIVPPAFAARPTSL